MSDNVIIRTVNQPTMVIVGNQAVSGPAGQDGATGATGSTGPNSVTSATSTEFNGILAGDGVNVFELDASATPLADAAVLYNEFGGIQATGFSSTDDGGGIALFNSDSTQSLELQHGLNIAHILYNGSLLDLNIQGLGNYTQTFPTGTGKFALTQTANGEPDKLTNGTITGTLAINSTSYTFGTTFARESFKTALAIGSDNIAFTSFNVNGAISVDNAFRFYNGSSNLSLTSSHTSARSVVFPDASGKVALTANANGEPDKLTNGTISGTLAINSTSYTYGTGAAAAHVTALGLDVYFQRIDTAVQAFSTTYVNGPDLTIPAGTYDFEIYTVISSVSETSGGQSNFRCTPTTDTTTLTDMRANNIGALGVAVTPSTSIRAGTNILNNADFIACFFDAPNNYANGMTRGTTVLASATTVSFRIKQRTATDAVNPATIAVGSYIKFTRRS